MSTFLIATRNKHKVGEIRGILGSQFTFLTLDDYPNPPAVIEDAHTFAGNATKKAVELARWIAQQPNTARLPTHVLADDSGLEVDALNGAPGVHSARFAALDSGAPENSKDTDNNAKLLRLLRDIPEQQRTARFRCVIALTPVCKTSPRTASPACDADEIELGTQVFDGSCEGRIQLTASGKNGFGYDPLFIPNGHDRSFAEIGEEVKNRISHRAQALEKLRQRLVQ